MTNFSSNHCQTILPHRDNIPSYSRLTYKLSHLLHISLQIIDIADDLEPYLHEWNCYEGLNQYLNRPERFDISYDQIRIWLNGNKIRRLSGPVQNMYAVSLKSLLYILFLCFSIEYYLVPESYQCKPCHEEQKLIKRCHSDNSLPWNLWWSAHSDLCVYWVHTQNY